MNERANSILIVDDEVLNITALTCILKPFYTIYVSKDGASAINTACDLKPDVILLDVIMPDLSGFDVIQSLKENEETKDIPVIFVTGQTDKTDEEMGLSLGAADYITKPFEAPIVKLRVKNQIQIVNQMRLIQHLSMTDVLTETSNRRQFNIRLNQEWHRAQREYSNISLLLADIDDFKKINDIHGHLYGDEVLRNVADNIKHSIKRPTDLVARWGGEEFAILLPSTTHEGALHVAEDIRLAVERRDYPSKDLEETYVTISVGVSSALPEKNSLLLDFVDVADKALYRAKSLGKNVVCALEN